MPPEFAKMIYIIARRDVPVRLQGVQAVTFLCCNVFLCVAMFFVSASNAGKQKKNQITTKQKLNKIKEDAYCER